MLKCCSYLLHQNSRLAVSCWSRSQSLQSTPAAAQASQVNPAQVNVSLMLALVPPAALHQVIKIEVHCKHKCHSHSFSAKRRSTDSSILSVVHNMMESDAEQRRVSDARFAELIDLMREQTKADAEERAAANARDRELQSFQTRWMDSLLSIAARMAPRQEDQ